MVTHLQVHTFVLTMGWLLFCINSFCPALFTMPAAGVLSLANSGVVVGCAATIGVRAETSQKTGRKVPPV